MARGCLFPLSMRCRNLHFEVTRMANHSPLRRTAGRASPRRQVALVLLAITMLMAGAGIGRAESQLPCQQFQLDAYRQQYHSADECWADERGMKGASEYCCNAAFGGQAFACRRDIAKINIDWVFSDAGAKATYARNRRGGRTPYEAVLHAQGHNSSAQESIRACAGFATKYAAMKDRQLRDGSRAPLGCEQAERNVLWVLFLDKRARQVYDVRRKVYNESPYKAVMFAQRHNPAAQETLRICRHWVEVFASVNE